MSNNSRVKVSNKKKKKKGGRKGKNLSKIVFQFYFYVTKSRIT